MEYTTVPEKLKDNLPKKKNGGARPGAGRPLHGKNAKTIEREAVKRAFQDRVARNADKLFNAQIDLAVGEKYLMVIKTVGSGAKQRKETSIVTDQNTIKEFLDGQFDHSDVEYYFMTTKPANNMALDSLLNRSFGKAEEKLDLTSGGEKISTNLSDDELQLKIDEHIQRRSGTSPTVS